MSTETSKRKERIAKDTLGTNIIARHTCFLTFKSPEMHASPGSFRKSEVAKTSVTINSILVNIPHPLYSLNLSGPVGSPDLRELELYKAPHIGGKLR